jgi:hypothetical protein
MPRECPCDNLADLSSLGLNENQSDSPIREEATLGIARLKIFNPGQISIFAFLCFKYWFLFLKIKNQKSIANIDFPNSGGEENIDI